jgi:peptide chain release factor 2
VRVTHRPTGTRAESRGEKSQHRNYEAAFALLRAKLYRIERRRHDDDLAERFDERGEPSGGEVIRSYALEPHKQVVDLATGVGTERVEEVLAGDLDGFLLAAARRRQERR